MNKLERPMACLSVEMQDSESTKLRVAGTKKEIMMYWCFLTGVVMRHLDLSRSKMALTIMSLPDADDLLEKADMVQIALPDGMFKDE